MLRVDSVPVPTRLSDGLAYSVSEFDAEFGLGRDGDGRRSWEAIDLNTLAPAVP